MRRACDMVSLCFSDPELRAPDSWPRWPLAPDIRKLNERKNEAGSLLMLLTLLSLVHRFREERKTEDVVARPALEHRVDPQTH